MMIWREVEQKYGKKMADKMKNADALNGITVSYRNGEIESPKSDIKLAYKEVTKREIGEWEWD